MLRKKEIQILERFNRRQLRASRLSFSQAQKIFKLLHQEFLSLKANRKANPLEAIEIDVKVAKILNSLA